MNDARELEKLEAWLSDAERVAVVGVGNIMRRDDAVGVEIVKLLQGKISSNVLLIEAETMPENYIDQIVDFLPSHILILDSGLIGEKPGDTKLTAPTKDLNSAVSSHTLPLQVFCAYLEKAIKTKILMLIIQPKNTEIGDGLTKELKKAAQKIADFLVRGLP
jgi:hydrogenase 3 maturation protease